ncbi:MAG: hypothetical protein ACFFCQ_07340 [Promethearchaeota archaeon]
MVKYRNVVLKLGGSAITKKKDTTAIEELLSLLGLRESSTLNMKKLFSSMDKYFNWDVLNSIGPQVAEIYENVDSLIIIHGAGLFGHSVVSHFLSTQKSEQEYIGWPLTILCVTLQNQMIVGWLQELGIPAISIPPHATYIGKEAFSPDAIKLLDAQGEIDILNNMLYRRYVPVLYGDMVIDTTGQYRVLSGDTLLPILVRELNNIDLVLAGLIFDPEINNKEVGVYTLDPSKYDRACLIRKITVPENDNLIFNLDEGRELSLDDLKSEINSIVEEPSRLINEHRDDVTGEMIGKLEDLIQCARYGVKGYVVDISRLKDVILGEKEVGTRIVPQVYSDIN